MLPAGGYTFKAVLVMTSTTADSEAAKDSDTCSDFTLDNFDGSNGDPATITFTTTKDDSNNRGKAEVVGGSVTWTGIDGGSRDIQGVVLIRWVTNLGNSEFLSYHEFPSAYDPIGENLVVNFSSDGAVYIPD
jgi:hypothetical protein